MCRLSQTACSNVSLETKLPSMVFMFLTMSVLYNLIHLSDFPPVAIILVAFFHGEKSQLSFLKLCSFFTIPSCVCGTDLITALTKEITCGFPSAQHIGIFCFPIFWPWSRSLTHLLKTSVVFRVFDHAERIKMTFVVSVFLSLTKCYSEFRSFQANHSNPWGVSFEAVLTTSFIFGSLIEMASC